MEQPAPTRFQPVIRFAQTRPLLAFTLLMFGFSWLLWWLPGPLGLSDPVAFRHLTALGAFSPSLAAILLSYFSQDQRPALRWDWLVMAIPAVGILYIFCLPYASTMPSTVTNAGWVARILLWTAPAVIVAAGASENLNLRRLILPSGWSAATYAWHAAGLAFFPILFGVGYALSSALGEAVQVRLTGTAGDVALTAAASFIYILLFGGAMGEEAGLRGYLLPRLQARFSPLAAAMGTGLLWAVWMIPLQFNGYYPSQGDPLQAILIRAAFNLLAVFTLTWFYNRTRSTTVCILVHAGFTTCGALLPPTNAVIVVLAVAVLAMITEAQMWQNPARG